MFETSRAYTKAGSQRPLRSEEKALIRVTTLGSSLGDEWEHSLVEDMLDGGMGSIRFVDQGNRKRRLGATIREAKYVDTDGVEVEISINLDQEGSLFEVDFWKVDFSPFLRYPLANEIKLST